MKKECMAIGAFLFALLICLGLGGCGTRDGLGTVSGTNAPQSNQEIVQTGTVATDSWGYTGAAPTQIAAPPGTGLLLPEHTLLVDDTNHVVSGVIPTTLSFSGSPVVAATAPVPGKTILCYLNISLGSALTAFPRPMVSVAVGGMAGVVPGQSVVTVYNFDAGAGKWVAPQSTPVDSLGKVSFPVDQFSLWGIFL